MVVGIQAASPYFPQGVGTFSGFPGEAVPAVNLPGVTKKGLEEGRQCSGAV